MTSNQQPTQSLADILKTLSAVQNQKQQQHGDLSNPQNQNSSRNIPGLGGVNTAQIDGAPHQPWQPANQVWQPTSQNPPQSQNHWQPPTQQQYYQPPPQEQQTWQPPPQVRQYQQQNFQPQQHPQQQTYTPPPQPQKQPNPYQYQQLPNSRPQSRQGSPRDDVRDIALDAHRYQKEQERQMQRRGVNSATIIDWPTGLRCVMKTVAMNEKIIGDIRKLIAIQNTHELQWFASRKALIMSHQERAAKQKLAQKRLDDMLQSMGSATSASTAMLAPESNLEEELAAFDAKVYRAQHQMVKEMNGKLRALGVPFFGTRTDLVILKSESREGSREVTPGGGDGGGGKEGSAGPAGGGREGKGKEGSLGGGGEKKRITETELMELQKKMLDILQDLCEEK